MASRAPRVARDDAARKAPRVRRTPEESRARILDAARELIAERGPDAVGLKDVGRAAGVSHTLVVHYFGSYDALVQEVLRAGITRFRAQVLERISGDPALDPAAWLSLVFDELRDRTSSRLMLWALLTGRLDGPDAFFREEQGLRQVADALEARLATSLGAIAPERPALETTLVLGLAAAYGYTLAAPALWGALGRSPTAARDAAARDELGRVLLQTALAAPPRRR